MKSPRTIERLVERLLDDAAANLTEPPVPVEELATKLGVGVMFQEADNEISGALLRSGNSRVIAVNSAHSRVRQRFTIAHEIGHLRLHKAGVFMDHDLRVDERKQVGAPKIRIEALRAARSGEASHDEEEIEANRFAASLLMPVRLLTRSLDTPGRSFPLHDEDITELAKQYQVSVRAMTYRLLNLGVPLSA